MLFIVLYYSFIYGIVVVQPPALRPHCDLREGCQTLQWRDLNYVLRARVSVQGISLPLFHTLLPPHRQPSTTASLSSRALLEGKCATAAHHKHFISIPWSLVVHPAANDFLPHCSCFFLLQGSRKLECTAEVQLPRDTALPAGFYPWPWPGMGQLLWEVQRSSQIHQGQQSVGNREEGTDCKREEFNGKPRSACTWPSALL